MSKFLQRINKETHKFIFEFAFRGFSINLSSKTACKIKIIIEKNEKSFETVSDPPLVKKTATFTETLSVPLTLYRDKKRLTYLEKPLEINVILMLENEEKLAGAVKFDVSEVVNENKESQIYEKTLENCPDPKALLVFEVFLREISGKTPQKQGGKEAKSMFSIEKSSPSVKSLTQSPSFGSAMLFAGGASLENRVSFGEGKPENTSILVKPGDTTAAKEGLNETLCEKPDYEEKYMESQLTLQRNMDKYEEMLHLNLSLRKEKEEESLTLRRIIDDKNKALSQLASIVQGTDSSVQSQLQNSQEKIRALETEIRGLLEIHEGKEAQLEGMIQAQNTEILGLKQRLESNNHRIRLFLLKQSAKLAKKPLSGGELVGEVQVSAFQTIDLQGLMQGIYRKTDEIFRQMTVKLNESNETIEKLKEFISKHSIIMETLQARIAFLEAENAELQAPNEKIALLEQEIKEKTEKIAVLEATLAENDKLLASVKVHAERVEDELLENKRKISEAMNTALEAGGFELVEFFEQAIITLK